MRRAKVDICDIVKRAWKSPFLRECRGCEYEFRMETSWVGWYWIEGAGHLGIFRAFICLECAPTEKDAQQYLGKQDRKDHDFAKMYAKGLGHSPTGRPVSAVIVRPMGQGEAVNGLP